MSPKVSVIIPTYNRAGTIGSALCSIWNQTFKDYEVILVDDGSTDGTKYCIGDKPVRYIYQDHTGATAARNRGIDAAKGDYIAFLDSDDQFAITKLEKQVKVMNDHPEVILSHSSYWREKSGEPDRLINSGRFSGRVYPALYFRCPIAMPTVMVRRGAFDDGHRFIPGIHGNDDTILWAQIARDKPIIGIKEPLSFVSVNKNTSSQNLLPAIDNLINLGINVDTYLPEMTRKALVIYWKMVKFYLRRLNGQTASNRNHADL